jgi:hypothetical protein
MQDQNRNDPDLKRSLKYLSASNAVIWVIAVIALVIIMAKGSRITGLFPILAGGLAVGAYLNSVISRLK